MILGRPDQKKGRMSMWNDDHGACHSMVYDEDHDHSVEFHAVGVANPSDVRFEQLAASTGDQVVSFLLIASPACD